MLLEWTKGQAVEDSCHFLMPPVSAVSASAATGTCHYQLNEQAQMYGLSLNVSSASMVCHQCRHVTRALANPVSISATVPLLYT